MELSSDRAGILKQVRSALVGRKEQVTNTLHFASEVFYVPSEDEQFVHFKDRIEKRKAKAFLCENKFEFLDRFLLEYQQLLTKKRIFCLDHRLQTYLDSCQQPFETDLELIHRQDVLLVMADYLIASNASALIMEHHKGLSQLLDYCDHVAVCGFRAQMLPGLQNAMERLKIKYANEALGNVNVLSGGNGKHNFFLINNR